MRFMTIPINYKFHGLEEAQGLTTLVDQKFAALQKFVHDDKPISCDVEFEKVASSQNGQVFRVEANVMLNGTLYRADATEESFEKAIDEVRAELDKEFRRAKEKSVDLNKKAAREAKEQLLNGT